MTQYVEEMLDNKVKFLLFAHHRCLLDALEAALRGRRVRYMRIDGATPSAQRHEHVRQFQSDPDTLVRRAPEPPPLLRGSGRRLPSDPDKPVSRPLDRSPV